MYSRWPAIIEGLWISSDAKLNLFRIPVYWNIEMEGPSETSATLVTADIHGMSVLLKKAF